MSHNQETRVIHNADIRRKYRTCGREARLLYLLPIIQGGRRTPKPVRTRHSKTHHRPTTTDIQRLVRLSLPLSRFPGYHGTYRKINLQPVPTETLPS